MARRSAPRATIVFLAVGALALAALLRWAARPSDGPAAVAWDRVACAHCHMLVSDPRYAAQLQLASGEVLDFDDPGCLLLARAGLREPVRATWFHDSASEAWLAEPDAAFVPGHTTPMGYGFAVVRAESVPGALDAASVLAALRGRR